MMSRLHTKSPFKRRDWKSTTALTEKTRVAAVDTSPCLICHIPVGTRTPEGEIECWASLPCGHRFGSYCAKRWLGMAEQPACPICRQPMLHACGHPVLPMPVVSEEEDSSDVKNGGGGMRKNRTFMSENTTAEFAEIKYATDVDGGGSSLGSHKNANDIGGSRSSSSSNSSNSDSSPPSSSSSAAASTSRPPPNRLRRKRRLSAPNVSPPMPRMPANLDNPCDYCSLSLLNQQIHREHSPSRGHIAGRAALFAIRALRPHLAHNLHHSHGNSNMESAYWERWRKEHGGAFGEWWAVQQPPTEPAREPAIQGWVY